MKLPSKSHILELGMRMVQTVGGHITGADILEEEDNSLWAFEVNSGAGVDPQRFDISDRWVSSWLKENCLDDD
jgi:hypothetical protein